MKNITTKPVVSKEKKEQEDKIKFYEKAYGKFSTYELVCHLNDITTQSLGYQDPFRKLTMEISVLQGERDKLYKDKKYTELAKTDKKLSDLNDKQQEIIKENNETSAKYEGYAHILVKRINLMNGTTDFKIDNKNFWNGQILTQEINKLIHLEDIKGVN